MTRLAIKVDVDTERGTREGVPALLALFDALRAPATFLFSLGPDNTGRAIRRVLRPGFFKKVSRTSVVSVYGVRTLLNGVLWPGPHIGRRHAALMREVAARGYETGIHCYDHVRWQDGLARMAPDEVVAEFGRARAEYARVFGAPATTAGAAGWQANAASLAAYDEAGLAYASDARGRAPFFPRAGGRTFRTVQVPTTLPTLDELLGRPQYPAERLADHYLALLKPDALNVLTVHAELEGMRYHAWFHAFLIEARRRGVRLVALREAAQATLARRDAIPVCDLIDGEVEGRSGTLAVQA